MEKQDPLKSMIKYLEETLEILEAEEGDEVATNLFEGQLVKALALSAEREQEDWEE